MNKSALFLVEARKSAVAIMLNHKGDETQVIRFKSNFSRLDYIVNIAICDEPYHGVVSSLFVLSRDGGISLFRISKNFKILTRSEFPIRITLPEKATYHGLAVSRDGRYVAVLVNKKP